MRLNALEKRDKDLQAGIETLVAAADANPLSTEQKVCLFSRRSDFSSLNRSARTPARDPPTLRNPVNDTAARKWYAQWSGYLCKLQDHAICFALINDW